LVLGPGLLVNGILKPNWHRPRPVQVTEFGGQLPYADWWKPGCTKCPGEPLSSRGKPFPKRSFPSGEAASSTWLFAPAMVVPPPWRIPAYVGAAVLAVGISLARLAAGAHFLSDILIAGLLTLIVIWVMHFVIFRWRRNSAAKDDQPTA
jgi:membrane-associated phospholipid phosphatase